MLPVIGKIDNGIYNLYINTFPGKDVIIKSQREKKGILTLMSDKKK